MMISSCAYHATCAMTDAHDSFSILEKCLYYRCYSGFYDTPHAPKGETCIPTARRYKQTRVYNF